jgi:hypothetical protein
MSWQYAKDILDFAKTGQRPKWKAGKRTGTGGKPAKYLVIRSDVVRLRDEDKMSFVKIAATLGVSLSTVKRAYDDLRPEAVHEAAENGTLPQRGRYSHLGVDVFQKIRKMLSTGTKPKEIAKSLGCGTSTVYRVRRKMKAEVDEDQAAQIVAAECDLSLAGKARQSSWP